VTPIFGVISERFISDALFTSEDTMDESLLIAALLALGLVVAGAFVALALRKRKMGAAPTSTDYRALFILGLSFIPVGIIGVTLLNVGFLGILGLGVVYMVTGLANRDKWQH